MDEDDIDGGETIEIEPSDDDVIETEDGGAFVTLDDDDEPARSESFLENLAETIVPASALNTLATDYLDLIDKDREARDKRQQKYEEGLRRTGLGDDAPGGASFEGASKAVHPMLTEGCIDFQSRVMKELWPSGGPVGDRIIGDATTEKVEKAKRKARFMNWQLTVQNREARAEVSQMMTQVPMGGSQYLKWGWDEKRNKPTLLFVAIDDMLLPYAATNFYSSERKTHVQYLTQAEYEKRVREKMYVDADLGAASMTPEGTAPERANNKIEGREQDSFNVDGLRTVFEVYLTADIPEDPLAEGPAPYIMTVDKDSRKVLSLYRNWDEFDDSFEEMQWFVEYSFIPWRGAYGIGLPHIIGGLSAASTGALRALLDAAHISNSQTALKLKGGTRGGQSLELQPTQIMEIEGSLATDDIRKLVMPMPFNPPSPVLYQMLGFLVDAGTKAVRTSLDDFGDVSADTPVGTTLARMEQGLVVFSDIHLRQHDATARGLAILSRLNAMYLDDEKAEKEFGSEISRKDFIGPMDTTPVSDPNIFSEAQRYAQMQAVVARSDVKPGLYNERAVEKRVLETLKVPNPDSLLGPDMSPTEENAVNENVFATTGRPLLAFPRQDHIAHLKTHLGYMVNPVFGMSDLMAPTFLPIIIEHLKQHMAMWYASSVREIANDVTGLDISEAKRKLKSDAEKQSFDRMLAEASQVVVERGAEIFASFDQVIGQAQQIVQQYQKAAAQPQLTGSDMVAQQNVEMQKYLGELRAEIAKMTIMQKDMADQRRISFDGQKFDVDAQLRREKIEQSAEAVEVKAMTEAQRQEAEDARTAAEIDGRLAANQSDNETAMRIAMLDGIVGQQSNMKDGSGINPGS